MSDANDTGRAGWVGAVGVVAVLAAAGVILARSASVASGIGLAAATLGVLAVLLLAFPTRELGRAVACAAGAEASPGERWRAALAWAAAARAAWVLAAATAVAGFVSVFSSDSGGIARFLAGVGDRAVAVALGLLLALACAVPAVRLGTDAPSESEPPASPAAWQRALAAAVLLAVLAAPLLGRGSGGRFEPLPWLLHGPSWLVVLGGALALWLYLRPPGTGAAAVVALAAAGTVGIVLGLARGLHGFTAVSVEDVAGGLMFAVSSGYAALAGLAAVGLPLLDRDARGGLRPSVAAHAAVAGFPVVVLLLLALAILLAVVPMEKPAG
jgi:hypothetical protein